MSELTKRILAAKYPNNGDQARTNMNHDLQTDEDLGDSMNSVNRIACARGKTYISQKVCRYLQWLGYDTTVFNVGSYRRKIAGANLPHSFFDSHNQFANDLRKQAASECLADLIEWLDFHRNPMTTTQDRTRATNSTVERRQWIQMELEKVHIQVLFIESICTDMEMVRNNIRQVKLSSPDYAHMDPEQAANDFLARIGHYEESYETLGKSDREQDASFVKLINVGSQVIINLIHGYLQSRIVYYLMNLHILPRSILMCRHGESMFNLQGQLGGDSDLSPRGRKFAAALPDVIRHLVPNHEKLTVWTSTLRRTIQTAEHLTYPKLQWKALDEIDAGVCDGLTYEEVEALFPEDFAERDKDKFNYRYRGGESYKDLVLRLEPIIMELERQENILIIGHQAVLRAIYAYFLSLPHDQLPYIHVPLHTVIQLNPKAYGCDERMEKVGIEAVDTHRPRPSHGQRSSYGDRSVMELMGKMTTTTPADGMSASEMNTSALSQMIAKRSGGI